MKTRLFYTGAISLGVAAVLTLINLTEIKTSFGETFLVDVNIYPAAFFALLGLLLMYFGLRPLWRNKKQVDSLSDESSTGEEE